VEEKRNKRGATNRFNRLQLLPHGPNLQVLIRTLRAQPELLESQSPPLVVATRFLVLLKEASTALLRFCELTLRFDETSIDFDGGVDGFKAGGERCLLFGEGVSFGNDTVSFGTELVVLLLECIASFLDGEDLQRQGKKERKRESSMPLFSHSTRRKTKAYLNL
jgi:hypothetical protein